MRWASKLATVLVALAPIQVAAQTSLAKVGGGNITVIVSGVVTQSTFTSIAVGTPVSGSFTYDPNLSGTPDADNHVVGYNVSNDGSVVFGGGTVSWTSETIFVYDEYDQSGGAGTGPYQDEFQWDSQGPLAYMGRLAKELGSVSCGTCGEAVHFLFYTISRTQPVPPLSSTALPSLFPSTGWANANIILTSFDIATGKTKLALAAITKIKQK